MRPTHVLPIHGNRQAIVSVLLAAVLMVACERDPESNCTEVKTDTLMPWLVAKVATLPRCDPSEIAPSSTTSSPHVSWTSSTTAALGLADNTGQLAPDSVPASPSSPWTTCGSCRTGTGSDGCERRSAVAGPATAPSTNDPGARAPSHRPDDARPTMACHRGACGQEPACTGARPGVPSSSLNNHALRSRHPLKFGLFSSA